MFQEQLPRAPVMRALLVALVAASPLAAQAYVIVDTGQTACYDASNEIVAPSPGQPFHGQDAQYAGAQPGFTVSADGLTVLDDNTGLTWQQAPDTDGDGDVDSYDKLSWTAFQSYPATLNVQGFGGFTDWRLPTIKELYSLIDFSGIDPSGYSGGTFGLVPFIDTAVFAFAYGDESIGERIIDAQYWSNTQYVGTVFNGDTAVFGVNFADGRIKGYPRDTGPGGTMTQFVRCVRGNTAYGVNDFVDNGDGTVTDLATGLTWMQNDSGTTYNWQGALDYAETLTSAGHGDWRLPNAKELQSIVDYTRSPTTTSSPAIDPILTCTAIFDEGGGTNYPFYWTGTTHENMSTTVSGEFGVYVCFGQGFGWMQQPFPPFSYEFQDVHGAGAQRSDPKDGNPNDYPYGHGPQGDVVRIFHHVRCVRGTSAVAGAWEDLGQGLAGIYGTPLLTGEGTLNGGDAVSLTLSNALENAAALLIVGAARLDMPLYGGTIVPDFNPPGAVLVLVSDGSGGAALSGTWPSGVPSGFTAYFQYWIADAGGPQGFAASNALLGVTP